MIEMEVQRGQKYSNELAESCFESIKNLVDPIQTKNLLIHSILIINLIFSIFFVESIDVNSSRSILSSPTLIPIIAFG